MQINAVINEQVQYFSCLADIFSCFLPILKHRFLRIILCLLFGLSDMMHKAIGNTAEFGAFVAAERLDSKDLRDQLQSLLQDIQSGAFARRFAEDAKAGHPWFNAKRSAHNAHAIETASAKVRQTMPWLENDT